MKYDVAIIGGGISGLSAALFTGHAGLKTIVFDGGQSQIKRVSSVKNFLGATNISGVELIDLYQKQAMDYTEFKEAEVDLLEKTATGFSLQANDETFEATYVVVATNANTELLEALGFEIGVNENIKNGKVKKVIGINQDGITSIPNLYIAGLLAGVPSQVMIAAGQGASVGVKIAQEATGDMYMWHDV